MKRQSFLLKTIVLLLTVFFLLTLEGYSKEIEIYISPNGSDSNQGTKRSPLKSLEKANEIACSVHLESLKNMD